MSTRTPGPWIALRYKDASDPDANSHPATVAVIGDWIVGPDRPDYDDHGSYEDVARLMAAAPELLAALKRAEIKLAAYVGVCSGDKELTGTVLPMARAAVAKAEGRS